MDSQSTNLYETASQPETANPTVVASSPSSNSGGIRGGGAEVVALAVADMSGLNFEETVGDDVDGFVDQFSKGDFTKHACWLCKSRGNTSGSHIVNHLGDPLSRDFEVRRQWAVNAMGCLGSRWAFVGRSEIHGSNNSEKKVSTKKMGKKVSTKKMGKKGL